MDLSLYERLWKVNIKFKMIFMLVVLGAVGIYRRAAVAPLVQLLVAAGVACGLDFLVHWLRSGKKYFPKSALISGLIVGLLLPPETQWAVVAFAATVAILSKHVLRRGRQHLFNPAGFGLLVTILIFGEYLAWWAATPWWLVVLLGCLVAYSFGRFDLVVSFLVVKSLLLLGLAAFRGSPLTNGLLMLNFFFVFVMLVEPRTSPFRRPGRIVYGILAAVFSLLYLMFLPRFDPWICGLLTANLFVPLIRAKHETLAILSG